MIYTNDWVFIHIPKTSGINFKVNVRKLPEVTDPKHSYPVDSEIYTLWRQWQHQPISWWITQGFCNENSQYISIVRHPYSRIVSVYEHLDTVEKKYGEQFDRPNFDTFIRTDWLTTCMNKRKVDWKLSWPQHRWFDGDYNVKVFKMETELPDMEDFTGYKFAHTNFNTRERPPWEDYYTDELKEIVYTKYQEDFIRYGYEQ